MPSRQQILIESLGVYLPPHPVSTEEVLSGCRNNFSFPLEKISGIKKRRMAGETEFSLDIALKAVADCLAHSRYQASDIDLLICGNISRYDGPGKVTFEPCTAVRLKAHFGFTGALAFDLTNACAGMFTGISVAEAFLASGAVRRVMVVSGEYITHLTRTAQREIENFMDSRLACLTLGDAGVAVILERTTNNRTGFQKLELQTFGRYSPYCIAKKSDYKGMIMYTDSVNLTDVALKSGAKHALQVLHQAGWAADSFRHLIMHQTSTMTLNGAKREINRLLNDTVCNDENTVNNLEERGNTASTSHFVALSDLIDKNSIRTGDRIVFSITASGLTIGTALYVMDDLPERLRKSRKEPSQKPETALAQPVPRSIHFTGAGFRIESLGTALAEFPGQSTMETAVIAANRCLHHSAYSRNDIGLMIYCGVYRTEYLLEPAYAALLAGKLEMNDSIGAGENKTFAFDIFNGSAGFLHACCVMEQLLLQDPGSKGLVTAAETENNTPESGERAGICEMASAVILDKAPASTQGFSRYLFRYDTAALNAYTSWYAPEDDQPLLHVKKDPELESLYLENICAAVHEILEAEGTDLAHIDKIFLPQISPAFLSGMSEALGQPLNKFVDISREGQDLFSSSLPAALEHAMKNGLVNAGDSGLLIAAGSGIQVACAVYHF